MAEHTDPSAHGSAPHISEDVAANLRAHRPADYSGGLAAAIRHHRTTSLVFPGRHVMSSPTYAQRRAHAALMDAEAGYDPGAMWAEAAYWCGYTAAARALAARDERLSKTA